MPFKSEKQRRLCWILYNEDLKAGRTPKWDCEEWELETKKASKSKSNASRPVIKTNSKKTTKNATKKKTKSKSKKQTAGSKPKPKPKPKSKSKSKKSKSQKKVTKRAKN